MDASDFKSSLSDGSLGSVMSGTAIERSGTAESNGVSGVKILGGASIGLSSFTILAKCSFRLFDAGSAFIIACTSAEKTKIEFCGGNETEQKCY